MGYHSFITSNYFGNLKTTHMMEEGGPDVVQMAKKSEEAAPKLVVPYLVQRRFLIIYTHIHTHIYIKKCNGFKKKQHNMKSKRDNFNRVNYMHYR